MQETDSETYAAQEYLRFWKEWGVDTERLLEINRFERPPGPAGTNSGENLDAIRNRLAAGCGNAICGEKRHLVFGEGDPHAKLMFVGDSPGEAEDTAGRPFVGAEGQLLTKIIEAMGHSRSDVYVTNVLKCRRAEDRTPSEVEGRRCAEFLRAQISTVRPQFVIALGEVALRTLTDDTLRWEDARGKFHPLRWDSAIEVMPTYPPHHLLREPAAKKMVWEDLKQVIARMSG